MNKHDAEREVETIMLHEYIWKYSISLELNKQNTVCVWMLSHV